MMRLLGASVAAIAAAVGQSNAQDNSASLRLDVIEVTTQKRTESIVDVPISVTAYDNDTLRQLGVSQFDELSVFVPGLLVQEQSPNNPGFVIRGITSDSGEANIEPRVAVFQDGVSLSRSRGSYVELFDLERVEVVKGPQPTLFGRSALIGAVSIVQNKADVNSYNGYAEVGYGNRGQFKAEGAVNAPILPGVFGVRAAGIHKERDGIVSNPLEGQGDLNGVNLDAFRIAAALEPRDGVRIDAIYNYQVDDNPGTAFVSGTFPAPGETDVDFFDIGALNTFGGFLDGRPLGLERTVESITLMSEWRINDKFTLNSVSGYREFDSSENFDPDGFAAPLFVFGENATGDQNSTEFRLSYDDGDRFKGFVGAAYFREEGRQEVPLGFGEPALQAFTAPLIAGLVAPTGALDGVPGANPVEQLNNLLSGGLMTPVDITDINNPFPFAIVPTLGSIAVGGPPIPTSEIFVEQFTNFGETEAFDIFADATFALTDKLEVTGGIRYTNEDKTAGILGEILSDQPSSVPLTPFGTVFTGVTPGGEPIFRTENFDGLTWRAAATYEINDQINAFLTYARGRTPEIIAVSSFDFSPDDFDILDDEKVDAIEGGVKGVFLDGALFADLSVYYYDYRDFQTSQIVNGQIIALNAGDARSIGVETSFNWQITDTVSAGGNYGFNDFEFTTGAFDGNRPRLSPEHAISLYGEVTHSLAETGAELFLRPSFTWQSEVFFDNDNDRSDLQSVETGRLPGFEDTIVDELQESYALLNLRGGVTFQNFTLEAFATNLLDKEYIIDAGNTGDGFGIPTFIRGEPRLYGVNLRAEF